MTDAQQAMGLAEDQDDTLIARALADGYITRAAHIITSSVAQEVRAACRDSPRDLVEIGGGTGEFFDNIQPCVNTYVNVEPGRVVITPEISARLGDPRYRVLRQSAEAIALPDKSADVVFSVAAFDHIPDNRLALAEIDRVLRPGGTFVIALNNRGSWWKTLLARTAYWRRRQAVIARSHFIQWSLSELVEHLSERLHVTHAYTVVFFPHVRHLWPMALPVANAIGARCLPRRGAVSVVVAKKLATSANRPNLEARRSSNPTRCT